MPGIHALSSEEIFVFASPVEQRLDRAGHGALAESSVKSAVLGEEGRAKDFLRVTFL